MGKQDFRNKKVLKIECISKIDDVLHDRNSRVRNSYQVEYLDMPPEYLKQRVSWKNIPLVNGATTTIGKTASMGIICLFIILITKFNLSHPITRNHFIIHSPILSHVR